MAFEFVQRLMGVGAGKRAADTVQGAVEQEGNYVTATVITVGALFSDNYRFRLPWFQRAYAWREDHVGRLVADITRAMNAPAKRYFLGTIRIAGGDQPETLSLIDGQQRLLTLTILFALIRDFAQDETVREIADRAIRIVDNTKGAKATCRVVPQPLLEKFFEAYVQTPGGTLTEPDADGSPLAECERYVLENRNYLKGRLLELLPEDGQRTALLRFILTNCHVLIVAVEDEDEAWSMLSIDEETGLNFHSSERLKLSLVSVMGRAEQEEAGRLWDQCQGLVGADGLCRLLRHVRAIKQRRRSSKPIEKDISQAFKLNKEGLQFLRDELLIRSRHFAQILNSDFGDGETGRRIAYRLKTLDWLEFEFWVPPLLHWIRDRGSDNAETARFVENLERLAWVLRLSGADTIEQERRFISVIGGVDRGAAPEEMAELQIDEKALRMVYANLSSRTFYSKHYSGAVLRLLSLRLGNDPGSVNRSSMTIEHILPRNAAAASVWRKDFTQSQIGDCVNRLGNLALLAHEQNLLVGIKDYDFKRELFLGLKQPLARKAAEENDRWTPEVIGRRTEQLIGVLFDDWRLEPKNIAKDRGAKDRGRR